MIYLVTKQQELFSFSDINIVSIEESLAMINSWSMIQFDTETSGREPHICTLLLAQFGDITGNTQIVVDCMTISITEYKKVLESKLIIGQNLKFDLQFLYNYNIIPRKVYDTMIVEQLLYLGFPHITVSEEEYNKYYDFPYHYDYANKTMSISFALDAIAKKRLNIHIDKTVRGEIIWRGIDYSVIKYAAKDVEHLYAIMQSQIKDLRFKDLVRAAKIENRFVPVIAYLEWCGIHLNAEKWKAKMEKDKENLTNSKKALDEFVVRTPSLSKYVYVNRQGNLFEGFNLEPQVKINWSSSSQVVNIAKILGFNTQMQDKKTGEDKDSVLEKHLKTQKGVNDEFLKLYFDYQGYAKVVSSFGQGHLNQINPKTHRIHTTYRQLGAASGRMSCGSTQPNTDLASYKNIPAKACTYANMQQLPHDEETRGCFTAMEGNLWVSSDWSAAEARLAGDIYNDQAIKDIFLNGIDSHSMYAKIFFKEQLKDIEVNDIKKLRPDLRQLAKGPEFALNFGGGAFAIMQAINCTKEEADQIVLNYEEGFKGTAEFAKKGSKLLRQRGYVLMCEYTGHKMFWWDYAKWKEVQNSFDSEFWENYKIYHKGTGDSIEMKVKQHFKAASKWDRMVRNAPTQGTCSIMLKDSQIDTFNWVVDNSYFGKILLCNLTHDEANWEYPKEVSEFPDKLKFFMENSASKYCKSLPIPAEPAVGGHWIH